MPSSPSSNQLSPSSGSVVIPAFNEGAVIDRCLSALADLDCDVVVAANGCTDDTVQRARAYNAQVVEIAKASKIEALNAADLVVGQSFPRIYLDADVVMSAEAVRAVVDHLKNVAGPAVCAPRVEFDTSRASRPVRLFYQVFAQLPYVEDGLVGLGCYALNSAGRARWNDFPDVTADDLFVQSLFSDTERHTVEDASFMVGVPRTLRSLVRVRERIYSGNRELAQADKLGSKRESRSDSLRALRQLVRRQPALALPATVYLLVNAFAAVRSRRRSRAAWSTDLTSREV